MKAIKAPIISYAILACLVTGAGCFGKTTPYIKSPSQPAEVNVKPNVEGSKASTGGIQTTVTPSLETSSLANILPDDNVLKGFVPSTVQEKINPVPMQDGTRAEFSTVTKSFSKTENDLTTTIQASLTDTRSIPVLTAFIDSYAEYSNERGTRKALSVQGEKAWITQQNNGTDEIEGFGSITMLYRNRFLIQIDGNVGISQDQLIKVLNEYHFDQLK